MSRVLVLSGSRADYGYLKPIAAALAKRVEVDFERLEVNGTDDTPLSVSESAARALAEAGQKLAANRPDMMLVCGDRWEIASACLAASLADVPIAHLGSGERTAGAYDDRFRGSIEALATIKFALTVQGAAACSGYLAGCTSVMAADPLPANTTAIVALYPETRGSLDPQLTRAICDMLTKRGLQTIVVGSNLDVGSNEFAGDSWELEKFHQRLARAAIIVGNSSAGIIEAPILCTPSVNIGTRQEGRPQAESVFQCGHVPAGIELAVDQALAFGKRRVDSPYYNPNAVEVVTNVLCSHLGVD